MSLRREGASGPSGTKRGSCSRVGVTMKLVDRLYEGEGIIWHIWRRYISLARFVRGSRSGSYMLFGPGWERSVLPARIVGIRHLRNSREVGGSGTGSWHRYTAR